MFSGAMTALVTPFSGGTIDEESFRRHINWQIEEGIDGIVPCGTTGESATLSHEEHRRVIDIAIDEAKGRVPVIAGTGSNNTAEAVDLTQYAKDAGADGALIITPYYNKPTLEGLYAHYKRIAAEASMPIVVYNVPSRTAVNLVPSVVKELSKIPEVVGIKEASGDLCQVSQIVELCGEDFDVISGDDATVLPLISVGGKGVISVVSNVAPADMSALCASANAGDMLKAKALHFKLAPLARAMFLEVNPVPVKMALGMMGRLDFSVRMPLCPLTEASEAELRAELNRYGLI
ncbi:MAG: 4-hydroxy-tetrahydrodipicolinate synthase [Deltaproteobacteria bacterium]|nr:MAG: 4-hydroxy-tetrahydrodipicolinate synthase [Deltaproteobacteria bacterium]